MITTTATTVSQSSFIANNYTLIKPSQRESFRLSTGGCPDPHLKKTNCPHAILLEPAIELTAISAEGSNRSDLIYTKL